MSRYAPNAQRIGAWRNSKNNTYCKFAQFKGNRNQITWWVAPNQSSRRWRVIGAIVPIVGFIRKTSSFVDFSIVLACEPRTLA